MGGLTLQVVSGGCLSKKNFEVSHLETFPQQISIVQTASDPCEAYIPYGTKITYSYKELGLQEGDIIKVSIKTDATFRVWK